MSSKEWATEMLNYWRVVVDVVALSTNTIVLVSSWLLLYRDKIKPRPPYIFLENVATADIILSIWSLCNTFYYSGDKIYSLGVIECAYIQGIHYSSVLTSLLSILLIAVERFCFIVHGIRYKVLLTSQRARKLTLLTWIIGQVTGTLPILMAALDQNNIHSLCFIGQSELVAFIASVIAYTSIAGTTLLYTLMYLEAERSVKQEKSSRKIIKMLLFCFLTSFCFIITWLPLLIYSTIQIFYCVYYDEQCQSFSTSPLVEYFQALAYSNALINPILYAWWHKPYKRAIKRVLCPNRILRRPQIYEFTVNSISRRCT